jgi:hypothetical protein
MSKMNSNHTNILILLNEFIIDIINDKKYFNSLNMKILKK